MNSGIKKISFIVIAFTCLCFSCINILAYPLETIEGEEVKVPIIMYHSLSKTSSNKWVITPTEFENDLKYLKANGYETVFMQDLIDFVQEGVALPAKPIVLTFDDGIYTLDKYMLPLLQQYNMKAVLAIIGKITDDYSAQEKKDINYFPHLTWPQINKMVDTGLVEIQNHTYNLHGKIGAKKLRSESDADYKARLTNDLNQLQLRIEEMVGTKATTFAYPLGIISPTADEILKEIGFSASLSCYDKNNTITVGKPDCLFSLNRSLRPPGVSSEKFFRKFS